MAASALVLLGASPAAGHVTIAVSTTEAGAVAQVRLEVPHGCVGSATTEIAVRMPPGVSEVDADSTERWAADPRADSVTFRTDDPLPDALRDEVVLSLRLPDDVGAVLVFPVVQRCEEGESAWTEVAEDAASGDALELPAPVVVVTGPDGSARPMAYGAAGLLAAGCLSSAAVLVVRRRRA
ncbi:YcnI family protein [Alloalcanivorax gelatiniphagus]